MKRGEILLKAIGYFLLLPAVMLIIHMLDIYLSLGMQMRFMIIDYTGTTPVFIGLTAIAGAYLIKNNSNHANNDRRD